MFHQDLPCSLLVKHPARVKLLAHCLPSARPEKGREGLIAVAVDSPVIVPPFCGRTHTGAKWYAKGDLIQECSKQLHKSLAYGYEVSNGLGGHLVAP